MGWCWSGSGGGAGVVVVVAGVVVVVVTVEVVVCVWVCWGGGVICVKDRSRGLECALRLAVGYRR